ncbi:MAG TPA: LytTR family DNA-binding domain-containing protein [Syntrophorhabdaceae bacterium]|nr:LytTR family DNA-binding domain-containing protein [Syntrophorhabdaceae bacterium]
MKSVPSKRPWNCGKGALTSKNAIRTIDEVYYFKAEDKYTIPVTKEGESLIKKSIRKLIMELDPYQFWQIHRGTE